MGDKYRRRAIKKRLSGLLAIPLIIVLAWIALRVGTFGGNLLYDMNISFVKNVDTGIFKSTLDQSLPLIFTTYNSGNINTSFTAEFESLIKNIFGFDLNNPLTILNTQSPLLYSYYNSQYLPFLANNMKDGAENGNNARRGPDGTGAGNKTGDNGIVIGDPAKQDGQVNLKEDASSITYAEDDKKKDMSDNKTVVGGGISIQNETEFKIDIEGLISQTLKINFDKKGPKVLIYHTHATEGYLTDIKNLDKKNVSGWTLNARYSVVRVGDELAQNLKKYNIDVVHNGTVHDYPNYKSSYSNSLNTITRYLKSYPSIKILFDIHRDGLGEDGPMLRTVTTIKGKNAAKIMFVVGTNETGLNHPDWKENLKLAIKLQARLNEKYPGLAKPIYLSKNRYNQHMSDNALIIEIGGDGNLLSEAVESTKYLAEAIKDVIK